jgi:DNA-binding transcriptional LysR family regulator
LNFTTLRYFLTAAEELNITHAANRLYISQQALSAHISKLEDELDLRLFNRSPVFSLTYAGQQLQIYASKIINLEREIHQMAGDLNHDQRGELRLGISHTCGRAILPSILPDFRRAHPLIDIVMQEDNSREMEYSLQHGKLDLMIDFSPILLEGAQCEKLIEERLFLVVPKRILNASYGACYDAVLSECSRNLDLKLFEQSPFILLKQGNRVRTMLDHYMNKIHFTPKIILETENTETAFALAEQGMGITVYPELFRWCIPEADPTHSSVEFFPFRDRETTGTLVIAWLKEHYQSRAAAEFIEACRSAVSEIRKKQISV